MTKMQFNFGDAIFKIEYPTEKVAEEGAGMLARFIMDRGPKAAIKKMSETVQFMAPLSAPTPVPRRTLQPETLAFIRVGADIGDTNRFLPSAAANLAECGCPPALVQALLTPSALYICRLSPAEVGRAIDSALARVAEQRDRNGSE